MLPRHPDRIQITFDDHRLVANAGLLLPVTLAQHLGLRQLVDATLIGDAPGREPGDKMMTLVASAGWGDCLDDADALRTGGTVGALGGTVKAPSTLGTFLRSFRWGHVLRVSRELLAQAWAAGAGPGDAPLTIDLDSTICETYGLAKEGAATTLCRPAGAITRCCRRRNRRRAPAARGLRQLGAAPISCVGGAGAPCWGQGATHCAGRQRLLCPRPGRGLPQDGCPCQHVRLRNLIEIPETDWTPIPYWMAAPPT